MDETQEELNFLTGCLSGLQSDQCTALFTDSDTNKQYNVILIL